MLARCGRVEGRHGAGTAVRAPADWGTQSAAARRDARTHTCIPSTAKVPQSLEPSIFGSFSVVTCNNKPAPRHHGSRRRRRRAEGSTEAVAGQMGYGTGDTSGDTKTLEAVWS